LGRRAAGTFINTACATRWGLGIFRLRMTDRGVIPHIAYEHGGYLSEVQTEVTVGVILAVGVGHSDQKYGSSASTSERR
jgi:hypothetical protein